MKQLDLFPINRKEECVHTEHCCFIHGCQYRDPNCPVENDLKDQSFYCNDCLSDEHELRFEIIDRLNKLITESNERKSRGFFIEDEELRRGTYCGY